MLSGVTLQDKITEIRLRLQQEVYKDPSFNSIFEFEIKNVLQVYHYEFNTETNTVKITVNKNNYSDTNGFMHDKAYYSAFINNALTKSLLAYNNAKILNGDYSSVELIDMIIKISNENPGASYKLFDATPILNNIIIIYL